jgi:hypothetical protein
MEADMANGEYIILGRVKQGAGTYADGQTLVIHKHSWDCGWYWGFGYIGNAQCHFHFDTLIGRHKVKDLFEHTLISDSDWWVIRDLYKQAYALKEAAATYQHGGHLTHRAGVTDIIKDKEVADRLNKDLGTILDKAWAYLQMATTRPLEVPSQASDPEPEPIG